MLQAHNKRATVLFLMHRYEESIEVCQLVLQLNPYHFGAASGMGMCQLQLENHPAALAAFERALAINPAMDPIQTYVAALKAKLADDGLGRSEGL
jgi:tetratricopeptide (TPR) repeat protein